MRPSAKRKRVVEDEYHASSDVIDDGEHQFGFHHRSNNILLPSVEAFGDCRGDIRRIRKASKEKESEPIKQAHQPPVAAAPQPLLYWYSPAQPPRKERRTPQFEAELRDARLSRHRQYLSENAHYYSPVWTNSDDDTASSFRSPYHHTHHTESSNSSAVQSFMCDTPMTSSMDDLHEYQQPQASIASPKMNSTLRALHEERLRRMEHKQKQEGQHGHG